MVEGYGYVSKKSEDARRILSGMSEQAFSWKCGFSHGCQLGLSKNGSVNVETVLFLWSMFLN